DDGYLSERHAASAAQKRPMSNIQRPTSNGSNGNEKLSGLRFPVSGFRRPLRARNGRAVTQLWYAREGIVTPEMEFIAIRENARIVAAVSDRRNGGDRRSESAATIETARNALCHQHRGQSFGAYIPREITPDFVRVEVARGRAII